MDFPNAPAGSAPSLAPWPATAVAGHGVCPCARGLDYGAHALPLPWRWPGPPVGRSPVAARKLALADSRQTRPQTPALADSLRGGLCATVPAGRCTCIEPLRGNYRRPVGTFASRDVGAACEVYPDSSAPRCLRLIPPPRPCIVAGRLRRRTPEPARHHAASPGISAAPCAGRR